MKKKKLLSILSTGALALSLFAPLSAGDSKVSAAEATAPKWDVERYGDRVDIDGQLNLLSNDSSYLKQAEKKIKEQAAQINFNEDEGTEGSENRYFTTSVGGKNCF